ncbi:HK97 gp10 family phage protein [Saccharopolyspora aridisoli]|uniref:HK97 gp10 family phage protein n=1 Tax=Saccharopolyspora aridisoli TaxID=2530385 RepID=A0A4R4UQ07_9PSEU|nr:HK97 gp10 family phage protein [Saccharopolyspora aridisoli]TDC92356.1 HK97 gp10 family phage protein [Saccharopolyspora aridisoli]
MRYRRNSRSTGRFLRSSQLYPVVRETTREIARRARRLAPVGDTGDYQDGITTSYHGGWTDGRLVGEVEATAPHSAAVEFGNRGNQYSAQHVLRRAAAGEE